MLAKQESKTKGGKSSVSKQFEQRFSLPSGVNPEKISSKLSNRGILTVTAPSPIAPTNRSKAVENKTGYRDATINTAKQSEGLPEPKMKYEKDKIEIRIDAHEYR